jgi:hypothetical protein
MLQQIFASIPLHGDGGRLLSARKEESLPKLMSIWEL